MRKQVGAVMAAGLILAILILVRNVNLSIFSSYGNKFPQIAYICAHDKAGETGEINRVRILLGLQ